MSDHVWVVSHRRSGTHLVIDAIRNNFSDYSADFITVGPTTKAERYAGGIDDIKSVLASAQRVIKCHTHADMERFFADDPARAKELIGLIGSSKIINVHRDGRDVITSLYHYAQHHRPEVRDMPFGEFLKMPNEYDDFTYDGEMSRIEYWRYHVEGWSRKSNVLHMSYEEMINDFNDSMNRICRFLGYPERPAYINTVRSRNTLIKNLFLHKYVDRGIKRLIAIFTGKKYSSVLFRKGGMGDYENHFSEEDLKYYREMTADMQVPPDFKASESSS